MDDEEVTGGKSGIEEVAFDIDGKKGVMGTKWHRINGLRRQLQWNYCHQCHR
jgi:hypothetical protein